MSVVLEYVLANGRLSGNL